MLARFARVRLLRHALPISLLILRKKPTVLQSNKDTIKIKMLKSDRPTVQQLDRASFGS